MTPAILLLCLLSPWLALLAWHDCRDRRLPNVLTLGGAAVALVCRYAVGGMAVGNAGALGGVLCGLFLLLPFILHAAGGGDVKMLFAVGCATGAVRAMDVILFTSLAGLGLMAFMLIWGNADRRRLMHFIRSVFDWRYDRKAGRAALPPKDHEKSRVPFGVAIAAGTVFALMWEILIG